MHEEISAAAAFVATLFEPSLSQAFVDSLAQLLEDRYRGHWHADDPERGSAYRCLSQAGSDRPETLVKEAWQLAQSGVVNARVPRWTVFCDPGCVSARLGDSSEWGSLQEVYGTLPQLSIVKAPEPSPTELADALPNFASPQKRGSRAIQIVRPESRQAMQPPVTPGANVSIIPPTPATARPLSQPSFAPASHSDRSITPTVADPFVRPHSRSSSSESSSDGGHSSDRGSEIGSVFSATSHETLFPGHMAFNGQTATTMKRSGMISHHRHTSSVSTTASSNSTGTSASSISRPTSAASGSVVQEHSNGKVGVLGGGVLLGMPQASTSGDESSALSSMGGHSGMAGRRPRGRGRSRARSANFHAQQQQQAIMAGRWPYPDQATMAF